MRHVGLLAALVTASVLLAFGATELGLRASGHRPWAVYRLQAIEPTLHDPDPELGWVLRPGHWRYGPYAPTGSPVDVTILLDRTRRTRAAVDGDLPGARPEVLLLGCSFTFGWAVSDDQTWAWRLQEDRPDLDVRNRGTGAYGTLQSLLLLERVLASGERPARVIYGYIPEHGIRNVGNPGWLRVLAALSGQNIATFPYCTPGPDGRVVRHPPERYPVWPLREWSAAITLLQDRWFALGKQGRAASENEVTLQLLSEMDERCRAAGVRFSVLLLKVGAPMRDVLVPFASTRHIDVIDCDRKLTAADRVPGDLHPNGRVHQAWGDCVATVLEAE